MTVLNKVILLLVSMINFMWFDSSSQQVDTLIHYDKCTLDEFLDVKSATNYPLLLGWMFRTTTKGKGVLGGGAKGKKTKYGFKSNVLSS